MSIAEQVTQLKQDFDDVYGAGKQSGTDEMWDKLQDYGNRKDYRYAFFYTGFQYLDPKHTINATHADSIMSNMSDLESVNWNKFNLSAVNSLYSAFAFCEKLTTIDTDLAVPNDSATLLNSVCRNCNSLTRIQKITAFPTAVWKNSFDYCTALTHVIFDGTIGANGLDLHWSTGLDKESITSIINALSTTTSGLSITLSQTAVDNAFANDEESVGSNTGEWAELIETKSNWTINLV